MITLWVVGMPNANAFSLLLELSSGLNQEIHTNRYSEKINTNVPDIPNLKLRLQDFYIPALTSQLKFLLSKMKYCCLPASVSSLI